MRVDVWIRKAYEQSWLLIADKPEFLHKAIINHKESDEKPTRSRPRDSKEV